VNDNPGKSRKRLQRFGDCRECITVTKKITGPDNQVGFDVDKSFHPVDCFPMPWGQVKVTEVKKVNRFGTSRKKRNSFLP
jgi:hypothetical protein